jgi:eukaryotic-like serine/threonine-protein kinase
MTRPLPSSADVLAPGQRIGPFVLLAPLGAGGSGRIWAAARLGQLGFNKRLVLKVMRQDRLSSASARRRFDREACLGARLRHPNLRAVHDLRSCEGRPYMALSWVDASLAELLQHAPNERLPPAVVCWIGMQCCSALTAAHGWVEQDGRARTIVHRDVSPGNILLSVDGHALLADLAAADDDETGGSTQRFFGSLSYAAPEALRQHALDARADLYSLGCVLYEALAGAPAFEGDDERAVMFQILERGAPALSTRAPGIPAELAGVVQRCLQRNRDERFESARELHAALAACCAGRTAFSLERETAALIREVLGTRIREREEMMHAAFERFAPSALARTDTLPIAGAETPPPLVRPRATIPERVARGAASTRRRWPLLAALFALLLVVALLVRMASRPAETVETRANRRASERPPGDATRTSGGSPAAADPPPRAPAASAGSSGPGAGNEAAGAAAPAPAPNAPSAKTRDAAERAAVAPAATLEPTTEAAPPAAAGGVRPEPPRKPRERARPAAVQPDTSADPSANPFDNVRLEGDPYAERLRRKKAAGQPATTPAPAGSTANELAQPAPAPAQN